MSIRELCKLVPPPTAPAAVPARPNWSDIEEGIGVTLPRDYKQFVELYGTGLFAGLIRIFNAFEPDPYGELNSSIVRISAYLRQRRSDYGAKVVPYEVYPSRPGLMAFGNDENGNELQWYTKGRPNQWSVVVLEGRGGRWQEFDCTMTEFLTRALTKEIRCKIWPRGWPRKSTRTFEPYDQ